MSDEELIAMARLAQRDERKSTGALYGHLASRIEALLNLNEALVELMDDRDAKLAKAVARLRDYAIDANYEAPTNGEAYVRIDDIYCQGGPARTTLAEIEGSNAP
jgi:hypothetical protein